MGNRAEEDYNFVFKGELGSVNRPSEPESVPPVFLPVTRTLPGPIIPLEKKASCWEGRVCFLGQKFWSRRRALLLQIMMVIAPWRG